MVYDGVPLLGTGACGAAVAPAIGGCRKGTALAPEREPGGRRGYLRTWNAICATRGCFVYLTQSEGLGSGALLAMSAGVPVIASNVGGLPEIVEHRRDRTAGGKFGGSDRGGDPRIARR